jgi:hypothetical protein
MRGAVVVSFAFLSFACGVSACGRSILDDAVGGVAGAGGAGNGAAGTGGGAGNGAAGTGGGAGSGAAGAAFGCAPGSSDQTCNDDPSVNAPWGTCLSGGGCECNDGFSYNPATGHCRPGSRCVAWGADPWTFMMALDHGDCASRPGIDCTTGSASHQDTVDAALLAFVQAACGLPPLTYLRVVLTDGCPSLVEVKRVVGGATIDASLTSCLSSSLAKQRWTCAAATECVLDEWDTLP